MKSIRRFLIRMALFLVLMSCVAPLSAEELLTFEGSVDFEKKKFDFIVDLRHEDFLKARAEKVTGGDYHFKVDIDHWKTPLFNLSSEIESLIAVIQEENGLGHTIQGRIWSQYSIVDYKPVRELSGQFEIKNNRLLISSLSFGNIFCTGNISLTFPYRVDLTFDLYSVTMNDFLAFWMGGKRYDSEGTVSGRIRATGPYYALNLKGNLEGYQGYVQALNFENIRLNIEGVYPEMQIAESLITQSDGMSFLFEGPINLGGVEKIKQQIKMLSLSPLVSDSDSQVEWTIKRIGQENSGKTELKYLKRKDAGFGSAREESDMLGIERTMEF